MLKLTFRKSKRLDYLLLRLYKSSEPKVRASCSNWRSLECELPREATAVTVINHCDKGHHSSAFEGFRRLICLANQYKPPPLTMSIQRQITFSLDYFWLLFNPDDFKLRFWPWKG